MSFFHAVSNFVSHVFSNIDDSAHKIANLLTHPSKAMALKEDLVTPRNVSYEGLFKKLDPILDTVDPAHNEVQFATTGSRTTEGQSPYFQKIAPVIVSAFFPAAGALASGIDGVSQGNTTQAIIGFTTYGVGSYVSAASAADASIIANGGTVDTSGIINLSTMQTAGKLVNFGAGAYQIFDAKDKLIASTGMLIPNMVHEGQAQTGISLSNAPSAYANFGHTEDTTAAAAALAFAAEKEKSNNAAVLGLGIIVLFLMR